MSFTRIKGLKGRVFSPDFGDDVPRKHPCRDCAVCQFCCDERCAECRKRVGVKPCPRRKRAR